MKEDKRKVFSRLELYQADPHDMERARRWGRMIYANDGLVFYFWQGITYVTPFNAPPMLQLIKGGVD